MTNKGPCVLHAIRTYTVTCKVKRRGGRKVAQPWCQCSSCCSVARLGLHTAQKVVQTARKITDRSLLLLLLSFSPLPVLLAALRCVCGNVSDPKNLTVGVHSVHDILHGVEVLRGNDDAQAVTVPQE